MSQERPLSMEGGTIGQYNVDLDESFEPSEDVQDEEIENETRCVELEMRAPLSPKFSSPALRRMRKEPSSSHYTRSAVDQNLLFSPTPPVRVPLSSAYLPQDIRHRICNRKNALISSPTQPSSNTKRRRESQSSLSEVETTQKRRKLDDSPSERQSAFISPKRDKHSTKKSPPTPDISDEVDKLLREVAEEHKRAEELKKSMATTKPVANTPKPHQVAALPYSSGSKFLDSLAAKKAEALKALKQSRNTENGLNSATRA